jgi:undecaprenyl pyrophosphate phosphatase UppP
VREQIAQADLVIGAVLVLYWRRLLDAAATVARPRLGRPNLLWQIAIAAVPAVVIGLLFEDWIDEHLFSARVVAVTLVLGGVLLLWLERHLKGRAPKTEAQPLGRDDRRGADPRLVADGRG